MTSKTKWVDVEIVKEFAEDKWITIKGAHVQVVGKGDITKGPAALKGKKPSGVKSGGGDSGKINKKEAKQKGKEKETFIKQSKKRVNEIGHEISNMFNKTHDKNLNALPGSDMFNSKEYQNLLKEHDELRSKIIKTDPEKALNEIGKEISDMFHKTHDKNLNKLPGTDMFNDPRYKRMLKEHDEAKSLIGGGSKSEKSKDDNVKKIDKALSKLDEKHKQEQADPRQNRELLEGMKKKDLVKLAEKEGIGVKGLNAEKMRKRINTNFDMDEHMNRPSESDKQDVSDEEVAKVKDTMAKEKSDKEKKERDKRINEDLAKTGEKWVKGKGIVKLSDKKFKDWVDVEFV